MSEETTKPAETARIVSGPARSKEVRLEWPVEFEGKIYESITVRRISTQQISTYVEALTERSAEARKLPTIDCPIEVWDAIDGDDMAAIEEAARDFLPRRLREAFDTLMASSEPTPANGAAS